MNYYEYYINKEEKELADRCQDLCYNPIYFESIENSRKALPREVVELSLSLDSVMFHYKRYLVGYASRPNGLYRAVRDIITYYDAYRASIILLTSTLDKIRALRVGFSDGCHKPKAC
ncbi:MAG: hypothetical protein E6767_03090 [Dysgonomonas sp.]|nr:hypothetical protein [Dysgonomonas sp.]